MNLFGDTPDLRYVATKRFGTIELVRDENKLWRDAHGTIWALPEEENSVDQNDGCGVGWFAWRSWFPWAKKLNRACSVHDYMYSCLAWQIFHTREESDSYLKFLIRINAEGDGSQVLAHLFKQISRSKGRKFWEVGETNN